MSNNSILNKYSKNSNPPPLPKEVEAINQLNLVGNIIPHTWFDHIKYADGKPQTNAILILSEIVYWYRPTVIKDEATGRFLGYKKKFNSDKLQRSHTSFEKQFGFSRRQVRDALNLLEEKNIITKELRTITTKAGKKLPNRLFIGIIPESIKFLNEPLEIVGGSALEGQPSALEGQPSALEGQHVHKTTKENTTKITKKKTHESMEHHHEPQGGPTAKQKNDDDDILKLIQIGLDKPGAKKLKNFYMGKMAFNELVQHWLLAKENGAIPKTWGNGLIFKKIKIGEMPPKAKGVGADLDFQKVARETEERLKEAGF